MDSYKVYKHTFPNGKIYIGITRQSLCDRWWRGKGYHHNKYILNAVDKYGWDNIKHEILYENLTEEQAIAKETELIKLYKSNEKEFGYNILVYGNRKGIKHSDFTKQKISKSKMGTIPWNRKPVKQFDKQGNFIKEYPSRTEATNETGVDFRLISAVCVGKRKSAGGFVWKD